MLRPSQFDTVKIAAMKITPAELRQRVGKLIFDHKAGYTIHRLLLVGGDIDVYDDKDIMWAFSTRCRPGDDEVRFGFAVPYALLLTQSIDLKTLFSECKGFPLVPYMSHGFFSPIKGGKVVSYCLMPSEYQNGKPDWIAADFKW